MWNGKGRRARFTPDRNHGGWLFRLFMIWFGRADSGTDQMGLSRRRGVNGRSADASG